MFIENQNRQLWKRVKQETIWDYDALKTVTNYQNIGSLGFQGNSVIYMNRIDAGTGETNRIGNAVDIPWISMRMALWSLNEAIASPHDVSVRFLLFVDHQANGSGTPPLAYVIDGATTGRLNQGFYQEDFGMPRFDIIHDEMITFPQGVNTCSPAGVYANGISQLSREWTFEGGPIHAHWKSTTGTVANCTTGALFYALQTEYDNVASECTWRFAYNDA